MKVSSAAAGCAIVLLGLAGVACSQADAAPGTGSLEDRLVRLESRQEKLIIELSALRLRVGGGVRAEPSLPLPDAPIAVANLPSLGVATRWAIIEYSDFQCPFCRRYFADTFPRIKRDYVQTGKVRYIFHNLPVVGPEAVPAAAAGVCAQLQGRFWDFHGALLTKPGRFDDQALLSYARGIGLDAIAYQDCMKKTGPEVVRTQIQSTESLAIRGTPAFFIGELRSDGTVQVRKRIQGAHPYAVFQQALDLLLGGS